VVRCLLAAHPLAIREPDNNGWCTLHTAVRYEASADVVKALIDAYPEAAGLAVNSGFLPLHLALIGKASLEVVQLLLSANHQALQHSSTFNGDCPLHSGLDSNVPLPIIQLLLDAAASVTTVPNHLGAIPLHIACQKKAPIEVSTRISSWTCIFLFFLYH